MLVYVKQAYCRFSMSSVQAFHFNTEFSAVTCMASSSLGTREWASLVVLVIVINLEDCVHYSGTAGYFF